MMNNTKAKDAFIKQIIIRGMKSPLKIVEKKINRDSSRDVLESEEFRRAKTWFLSLKERDQEHAMELIKEGIMESVFGVMVILDGASGGYPIPGNPSDFALYLQTYESAKNQNSNDFKNQYLINGSEGEDLHDLLPKQFDDFSHS